MAKDPAFLFYPGDWLGGTMGFTHEQKGCYIDLLILQFNNENGFTEAQAKQVLSISFASAWNSIKHKFVLTGNLYENTRLKSEILKRKAFSESRRSNALHSKKSIKGKKKAYAEHMEDENENKVIIDIEERKAKFINNVSIFRNNYPDEMLREFCEYWMEHNEGGKKMRFEMQEVFNIGRRLSTWKNNQNKFKKNGKQTITDESLAAAWADDIAKNGRK